MVLLGCRERTSIWLDSSSTAERPVFGLGQRWHHPELTLQGLATLIVRRCQDLRNPDARPLWQVVGLYGPSDRVPVPSLIEYGTASAPEFATRVPAQSLGPGCYLASVSGSGRVRFTIDKTGKIAELDHS